MSRIIALVLTAAASVQSRADEVPTDDLKARCGARRDAIQDTAFSCRLALTVEREPIPGADLNRIVAEGRRRLTMAQDAGAPVTTRMVQRLPELDAEDAQSGSTYHRVFLIGGIGLLDGLPYLRSSEYSEGRHLETGAMVELVEKWTEGRTAFAKVPSGADGARVPRFALYRVGRGALPPQKQFQEWTILYKLLCPDPPVALAEVQRVAIPPTVEEMTQLSRSCPGNLLLVLADDPSLICGWRIRASAGTVQVVLFSDPVKIGTTVGWSRSILIHSSDGQFGPIRYQVRTSLDDVGPPQANSVPPAAQLLHVSLTDLDRDDQLTLGRAEWAAMDLQERKALLESIERGKWPESYGSMAAALPPATRIAKMVPPDTELADKSLPWELAVLCGVGLAAVGVFLLRRCRNARA